MSTQEVELAIGDDAGLVAVAMGDLPVDEAVACVSRAVGTMLGTQVLVDRVTSSAQRGLWRVAVALTEWGPAGEWSVEAVAVDTDPTTAGTHAVIAALLGHDDVITAAMKRLVASGVIEGSVVVGAPNSPIVVGDVEQPRRLLGLTDIIPSSGFVNVRTVTATYGAARSCRFAFAWQAASGRADPTPLRDWYERFAIADDRGAVASS